MNGHAPLYGLVAEFPTPAALLQAARKARAKGYAGLDAYSPMPVEGLSEALGCTRDRVAMLALLGGIAGGVCTYALQWYSVSSAYVLNVGGRTPIWPGLVPATFEMAVLGAALAIFFGMLIADGLPRLYHPVFNASEFATASRNGFFLCIEALGPRFDEQDARQFLEQLRPIRIVGVCVSEVP